MNPTTIDKFPHTIKSTLRYSDTDRQGHVNNAVFATFIEMGRVDILYSAQSPLHAENSSYVVARIELNYHQEMNWPGEIEIATGISKIGNSSITFEHGIFQNGQCLATGASVCVHFDEKSRKSSPIPESAKETIKPLCFK